MSQTQIPRGWNNIQLDDCDYFVDIIGGSTPPRSDSSFYGDYIPWVRLGDMKTKYVKKTNECLSKKGLAKLANKVIPRRAVILSTRASIGEVALADTELCTNQGFKSIVCNEEKIIPEFLYYYLKSIKSLLISKCKTTTFPEMNKSTLLSITIPIPPITTQKKIIQKLDYLLWQIEEKKKEILYIINKFDAKKIHQSYQNYLLNAAFSGKLTNEKLISSDDTKSQIPKGWKSKKLGEIGQYKYGYNGKATSNKNGKPYLRITDINEDGSLKPDRVYVVINDDDFQKYRLQHNDIVIARTGATVGKSFLFTGTDDFVFASYLIRFRFDSDIVIPKFLLYVLKSNQYWNFIGINQSASAQPNVNATKMSNFEFLLPPIESQKKIVQILDEKFQDWNKYKQQIENIEQRHQHIRKSIDNISTAILNSAFTGKLVN